MMQLARKAFAAAIEEFIAKEGIDHRTSSDWRRLGTDLRMLKVWNSAAGNKRMIEGILDSLDLAIQWGGSPFKFEERYHELELELAAINLATELLDWLCDQIPSRYWSALPTNLQDLASLRAQLRVLAEYAHSNITFERWKLAPFLPRSRKRSLVARVHLERAFANEIFIAFRRHHYQAVADILNVFLNTREGEEITADNVRDAWRSHERITVKNVLALDSCREGEEITAENVADGGADHIPGRGAGSGGHRATLGARLAAAVEDLMQGNRPLDEIRASRRRLQSGHSSRSRAANVPRVRTI